MNAPSSDRREKVGVDAIMMDYDKIIHDIMNRTTTTSTRDVVVPTPPPRDQDALRFKSSSSSEQGNIMGISSRRNSTTAHAHHRPLCRSLVPRGSTSQGPPTSLHCRRSTQEEQRASMMSLSSLSLVGSPRRSVSWSDVHTVTMFDVDSQQNVKEEEEDEGKE